MELTCSIPKFSLSSAADDSSFSSANCLLSRNRVSRFEITGGCPGWAVGTADTFGACIVISSPKSGGIVCFVAASIGLFSIKQN